MQTLRELMMAFRSRFLGTAALVAALAIAPAVHAEHWHGGYGGYHHHGGGGAAGAAIIGGLVGLGLGAAIASNGGYAPGYSAPGYYAPPYGYSGPPAAYYTPAPPAVYYGY
jgi:hypothetical protein